MDWTSLNNWIAGSLNGSSITTLDNWTESELYQYAEEALHKAGARYLLVALYDSTSIPLVANQGIYDLPADHIATIYAAANGITLQPANVAEMEALDDDYTEAASVAQPTNWIGNELGLGHIRIYPPANAGGTFAMVYQSHPPDMTPAPAVGQPLEIKMPAAMGDYLAMKTLEQARLRQGDGQMMDAAQAFGAIAGLYERVFEAYWGMGE